MKVHDVSDNDKLFFEKTYSPTKIGPDFEF